MPGRSMSRSGRSAKNGEHHGGQLRIFSYLPNPRLWKATIAARLNGGRDRDPRRQAPATCRTGCGISTLGRSPRRIGRRRAPPRRSARSASRVRLLLEDAGLSRGAAFGTVPAAFSGDGAVVSSNRTASCAPWLGRARSTVSSTAAMPTRHHASTGFLDASLVLRATADLPAGAA